MFGFGAANGAGFLPGMVARQVVRLVLVPVEYLYRRSHIQRARHLRGMRSVLSTYLPLSRLASAFPPIHARMCVCFFCVCVYVCMCVYVCVCIY